MARANSFVNLSAKKIQIIDLARTLAILPVLAVHLAPTLPRPISSFQWGWEHFQRNGRYGVCLFFAISGFLITRILDSGEEGAFQPNWKGFYVRRAGRILPLFLADIFLGLLMVWLSQDDIRRYAYCFKLPPSLSNPVFWFSLFLFLFNWAEFFLMAVWQGVGHHWALFWSLAVEEQFYLFYPWILKVFKNEKKLMVFLIPIILGGIVWRWMICTAFWARGTDSTLGSFGYFDQIAIGILLYFTQKRFGVFFSSHSMIAVGTAVLGFSLLTLIYFGTDFNEPRDWIYAPTLLVVGFFFFLLGGMNLRVFESKHLTILGLPGKYSYGNYLFHIIVLYFLNSYLLSLNVFAALLIFTTVSTMVAAVSFHFFEMPVNRLIRKAFSLKGWP